MQGRKHQAWGIGDFRAKKQNESKLKVKRGSSELGSAVTGCRGRFPAQTLAEKDRVDAALTVAVPGDIFPQHNIVLKILNGTVNIS